MWELDFPFPFSSLFSPCLPSPSPCSAPFPSQCPSSLLCTLPLSFFPLFSSVILTFNFHYVLTYPLFLFSLLSFPLLPSLLLSTSLPLIQSPLLSHLLLSHSTPFLLSCPSPLSYPFSSHPIFSPLISSPHLPFFPPLSSISLFFIVPTPLLTFFTLYSHLISSPLPFFPSPSFPMAIQPFLNP